MLLGLSTLIAALILVPGADEFCYLFGIYRFGDECGAQKIAGVPCPQCGMTRSFVWSVRGHFVRAFFYNPAGMTLFLWIEAAGVIGAVRLITRDPNRLRGPYQLIVGWALFWLVFLYAIPFVLRIAGINPLP